jgi:hypothetical protein
MYYVQPNPFLSRRRLELSDADSLGWEPCDYPTLSGILMRPVEAGLWKLHETFDGTYNVDDLLDINEIMDVQLENKIRSYEYRARHTNG